MAEQEEKKSFISRLLWLLAFLFAVAFCVWLAVVAVRVVPLTYNKLTELSDSIYTSKTATLSLTSDKKNVVSGEPVELTWNAIPKDGVYAFTYPCLDGISSTVLKPRGENTVVYCNTSYEIEGKDNTLSVKVYSEKERTRTVPLTITFQDIDGKIITDDTVYITVLNTFIENRSGIEPTRDEVTVEHEATTTSESILDKSTSEYVQQPIYYHYYETLVIPVSDPNGFTDLKVKLLGVGYLNEHNEFIPTQRLAITQTGAMQFEVKNIGTKTSYEWKYDILLPSGSRLISEFQNPLGPNERSVITVGFPIQDRIGIKVFDIAVVGGGDSYSGNNSFFGAIEIVR